MKIHPLRISILSLSLLAAFSASAQSSDSERIKALEQKFNQSLSVIDQLQKRITELEQRAAQPTAAAMAPAGVSASAPAESVNARVETLEKTVSDLATSASKPVSDAGLPLHGFIDVDYNRSNGQQAGYDKQGFRLGTFDIYLTPQLGDRVKGLVELAYEYDQNGVLSADLERLQLGYVASDSLTVWGGRFHTPYGYWNTAFHHGAEIQTSITRPRMIAFEDQGGILPSHTVGVWGTGKVDTAAGRLSYDAFVGNSDSMRDGELDYNASGFNEAAPTVGFRLGISPRAVSGLTLGVHAVQEKIDSFDAGAAQNGQINMQMVGAFGFFESDQWELIGEYYHFNNQDLWGSAGTNTSWAGFMQGGYQFAPRWTGFARYEKADLSQNDPYFYLRNSQFTDSPTNYGSAYHQTTLGLRYDLDPRSALKAQVEQIIDEGNGSQVVNWLRTQYSVRF